MRLFLWIMLVMLGSGSVAWAEEVSRASGTDAIVSGSIFDEHVGVKPQFGILSLRNASGDRSSHIMGGVGVDLDVLSWYAPVLEDLYAGISTGFFYSRIDQAAGAPVSGLFLIPVDLKAGLNLSGKTRASFHAGFNLLYRWAADAVPLGNRAGEQGGSLNLYPNLGLDLERNLSKNVSLLIRPDITLSPESSIYGLAVGIGFTLG